MSLTEQLLFPFVLDLARNKYITDEIPYIHSQHREYVIKTHDPISIDEFLEYHYTNWLSPWYKAESYHNKHNPLKQVDGEIVTWENYKR